MKLSRVVNGAVSAFEYYCAGYLNPGASGLGYITTVKLSVGRVKSKGDKGTEKIVSYDRAEKNDAYMGQINRIKTSAFCGLNGALWGYDLARSDEFIKGAITPLRTQRRHDGARVLVWDVQPLLDATERLFGTDKQRRFPLLPGAMVPCAEKNLTRYGPGAIWCSIALAIAEDRENASNLFIQYTGLKNESTKTGLNGISPGKFYGKTADSILQRGEDQGILYKEIFMGYKELTLSEGEVGCALCCMPYITLAQRAIPEGKQPADLLKMTLSQWEDALKLPPLKKKNKW